MLGIKLGVDDGSTLDIICACFDEVSVGFRDGSSDSIVLGIDLESTY